MFISSGLSEVDLVFLMRLSDTFLSQSARGFCACYFFRTVSGIIIIILLFWEFFTSANADGFSLDFEWQQVSWTLLIILADLNNAVVLMVSTHPLISKSSSSCTNLFVTVLSPPVTIGITVTFMFHSFFSFLARYLSLFLLSFSFTMWPARTAKSTIWQILFLLIVTRFGHLAKIWWSVYISKSQRILRVSFSWTYSGLYIFYFFKLKLLAQFPMEHLPHPVMSSLILFFH